MKNRRERDGRLALAATLVLLLAVAALSYRSIAGLGVAKRRTEHAHAVIVALRTLHTAISDSEAARLIAALALTPESHGAAERAAEEADRALDELRELSVEDAAVQASLDSVDRALHERRRVLDRVISLQRESRADRAEHASLLAENEAIKAKFRQTLDSLIREETARLEGRSGEEAVTALTLQSIIAAGIVGVLLALAGDLAIRRELERRERAERERKRIFDIAAELMAIYTAEVTELNPAWERVLGYTREELYPHVPEDLLHPDDRDATREWRARLARGETMSGFESRLRAKDGTYRWLQWNAVPALDRGVIYATARDITEGKVHAQRLEGLAAELERSNRELQEFASVASHDLQEPLRKIRTFGDKLRLASASLDDVSRDYVDRMQSAAMRMQRLIDGLLALALVSRHPPHCVLVDLRETVREVLTDLESRIEGAKASIELGDLPSIEADPTQMHQLFQNLIGNALKFCQQGRAPRVRVVGGIDEGPPRMCTIDVEDDGIGFDEKNADRIFAAFQRLHGRSEYEGSGMGLAICRRIAERHGGTIRATSAVGRGSVFRVMLPVEQPPMRRSTGNIPIAD